MAYALQCCVRCSTLEDGHTGPGDRYLCRTCHRAGWRVDAGGNLSQLLKFHVHTWDPGRSVWVAQQPVAAATARDAYLLAKDRHRGHTVHVARLLPEPCSPGASHA
jgi:hypothetical protein